MSTAALPMLHSGIDDLDIVQVQHDGMFVV
jgi:hypothetical protein